MTKIHDTEYIEDIYFFEVNTKYSRTSMAQTPWDYEIFFEAGVVRAIEGL